MVKLKPKIGLLIIGLVTTLSVGRYSVYADDHHDYDEKYEHYEGEDHHDKKDYYDKYQNDDTKYYDDNDEQEDYGEYEANVTGEGTWNIWTRSIVQNDGNLPFTHSQTISMHFDNKTIKCYVIPREGTLFVPAKKVAEALNGKAHYYKTSKIMNVQLQDEQLIFRADTNVVYENLIKTPMPSKAFQFNNDLYVPVSVILNAFGYSVDWQDNKQQIICQLLDQ